MRLLDRYLLRNYLVSVAYCVTAFFMVFVIYDLFDHLAKFIESKGEGVQHLAFRVENIEEALEELKEKGVRLIDQTPRKGAGGAMIAFIHPKETNGVLVELCERD